MCLIAFTVPRHVRQTCASVMCAGDAESANLCFTIRKRARQSFESCMRDIKCRSLPAAFLRGLIMLYTAITVSNSAFEGMKKHSWERGKLAKSCLEKHSSQVYNLLTYVNQRLLCILNISPVVISCSLSRLPVISSRILQCSKLLCNHRETIIRRTNGTIPKDLRSRSVETSAIGMVLVVLCILLLSFGNNVIASRVDDVIVRFILNATPAFYPPSRISLQLCTSYGKIFIISTALLFIGEKGAIEIFGNV